MTFLFWIIVGVCAAALYEYLTPKIFKKDALIVAGYRLHHSLYGVAAIALGIWLRNYIYIALGVGILIQHTATDGLKFVSKEK
jgi:hypothetical protein